MTEKTTRKIEPRPDRTAPNGEIAPARSIADFLGEVKALWLDGVSRGASTGWASIDELFTVGDGQVSFLTGWPNSGKSEWLDALIVNLLRTGDWAAHYFSPENHPTKLHVQKLLEKWVRKPFGVGPNERIAFDEIADVVATLRKRVMFLRADESFEMPTITDLLNAAAFSIERTHASHNIVVFDPWNEIDQRRAHGVSETEFVKDALSEIRRWARACDAHVVVVAHPAKQARENGKLVVPRPDMISGSQHFWNKADNCLAVWRDFERTDGQIEVFSQKIRFKHMGRIGSAPLIYDRITGCYHEPLRDAAGREVGYSLQSSADTFRSWD